MKTLILLILTVSSLSVLGKGYPVRDGRYLDCWENGEITGTLYLYDGISQNAIDEFSADCVGGLVRPRGEYVEESFDLEASLER